MAAWVTGSPLRALAGVILVSLGISVGLDAGQPTRPFTSGTALVVVPAVVVDSDGRTITGLTLEDFEVREDGKPVEVTTFVPPADEATDEFEGRFITLLLDDLRTPATLTGRVKDIARRFVTKMTDKDVITVIRLNGDRATSSSRPQEVLQAINRFVSFGEPITSFSLDVQHALETVGALTGQMASAPQRRRVLVCIGTAGLFDPQKFDDKSSPEYSAAWFEAVRDAARHDVSVYVIDPTGMSSASSLSMSQGAEGFTAATGGEAFTRTSNFDGAVTRIWHESGSFYLLGYTPPANDGRLHDIDVRVKSHGATVRARRARG